LPGDRLQTTLRFFKALADESRLKMVGILADKECSVEELARLLRLTAPTVSHHLARLKEAGLVAMRAEGVTHFYRLDAEALRSLSRQVLPIERPAERPIPTEETKEQKVLGDFLDGEQLKSIPAGRKKRQVILAWLAGRFDPDVRYSEAQLNEIIKRHHPDASTLRRELVASKLMQREHRIYWRLPER